MFTESITALMIASLAVGQTPVAPSQTAPPAAQSAPAQSGPTLAPASSPTIVVPVGTAIQLTLMSAVKSKSTKAGDSVRAVVAFPVTIGTQLAIPAGTFVDGSVIRVMAHPAAGQKPSFRVHFTRLVFSNGYSVALNGENTDALLAPADNGAPANEVAELVPPQLPGAHFAMGEGQIVSPPPTQPASVGPNPGLVIGISLGATAAVLLTAIALSHQHMKDTDFVLYDAGWQFQMVVDSPITLDASQVSAAAAIPSAN